jgi:hypothetical protein
MRFSGEPVAGGNPVLPETWGNPAAVYAPTHGGPYPVEAILTAPQEDQYVVPKIIAWDVDAAQRTAIAQGVLAQVFPDVQTSLLSDHGTYGIVLQDGERAYKILRQQPLTYSTVENEAAAQSVLGREGIAPALVALVDAAPEYRRDQWAGASPRKPLFEGQEQILRIPGSGPVPIIVTELVKDAQLVEQLELPADFMIEQFDIIVNALAKHRVRRPSDCHLHYDPRHHRMVLIDFGNTALGDIFDRSASMREYYPHLTDEEYAVAYTAAHLINEFKPEGSKTWLDLDELFDIFKTRGMAGIHDVLLSPTHRF